MAQRIYSTRSQKVEPFQAEGGNRLRMYVCGPTVYDLAHVGHARSYVFFDVVRRHLLSQGLDVIFQQNFSDIDEKITAKAIAQGRDPLKVAEDYIGEFLADMDLLKVERATVYSRASEHVGEIISAARALIDRKAAYVVEGFVYFDHKKSKAFGTLTHQDIKSMIAREATDPSSRKRSLLDFALWQECKPGDPSWDSPWGKGKPGWHIECYVMSREHLGHPLDIKGGGRDLIYPHHESEAAICDALTRKPYARVWMHNGFVTIGKTKMSKSLHNFVTIREVLSNHPPGALRMLLLSVPYRETLDWSPEAMLAARKRYDALANGVARLAAWGESLADGEGPLLKPSQVPRKDIGRIEGLQARFNKAMDNDFDTPSALSAMEEAVTLGVKLAGDGSLVDDARRVAATIALRAVREMNETLQVVEG
jgi:cysteinyl-tRNA synthetase